MNPVAKRTAIIRPYPGLTDEQFHELENYITGAYPHVEGEWDGEQWNVWSTGDIGEFDWEIRYIARRRLAEVTVREQQPTLYDAGHGRKVTVPEE